MSEQKVGYLHEKIYLPVKKVVLSALDKNAWMLAVPGALVLGLVDWTTIKTMLQWMLFAGIIAGFSIMLSRIVFPQIDLSDLVARAKEGSTSAGLVVAGLMLFFGLLFLSVVIWVKG